MIFKGKMITVKLCFQGQVLSQSSSPEDDLIFKVLWHVIGLLSMHIL